MISAMTAIYFFPDVISKWMVDGFNVFMGIYSWIFTFGVIVLTISFAIICVKTYTDKLDKRNEDANIPEFTKLWKDVVGLGISIYTIFISFAAGFYYITILYVISVIITFAFLYVKKDFAMKCLKLKLAHTEQNDFGV